MIDFVFIVYNIVWVLVIKLKLHNVACLTSFRYGFWVLIYQCKLKLKSVPFLTLCMHVYLILFCIDEGDEVITVNLFHGGNLKWLPVTRYFCGRLTSYILDVDDLDKETLRVKTKVLGYGGLFCLYYRTPGKPLEAATLILDDVDIIKMKWYARKNNNKIDVYVKHTTELDFLNIGKEGESLDSSDVEEHSDSDDMDFVDSEYSMSDQDDRQYSENVDEDVDQDELDPF